MNMRAGTAAGVTLAAALLTGCGLPDPSAPTPHVTEDGDLTVIHAAIGDKAHYPAGTWSGQTAPRWEFCFDHDGGWTCVPVSEEDYGRYAEGDVVLVRQPAGDLAEVSGEEVAR